MNAIPTALARDVLKKAGSGNDGPIGTESPPRSITRENRHRHELCAYHQRSRSESQGGPGAQD
jgi:hypothetical protein